MQNYKNYEYLSNRLKKDEDCALYYIEYSYYKEHDYEKLHNDIKKDVKIHLKMLDEIKFFKANNNIDIDILKNKEFFIKAIKKDINNANYYLDNKKFENLLKEPNIMLPVKDILFKNLNSNMLNISSNNLQKIYGACFIIEIK